MSIHVERVALHRIETLRWLFLQETNAQIRYNACHERGWTDSYLFTVDDESVGYGSVKGREVADRDTVFEFYVVPPFRTLSPVLFRELLAVSGALFVESQSNALELTALLRQHTRDISSDVILFADHVVTAHAIEGARVRFRHKDEVMFPHLVEPTGDYVLEIHGEVVASGGFLLHYNVPFADLYMEVREDVRRRGYATLLLQEVKKACYLAGRVPAARCNVENVGSRGALLKAGMRECGSMLMGRVTRAS